VNIFIASIHDKTALLTSEESWHCAKVLRRKAGENVNIIDGKGNFYEGVLELVSEKQCRVSLTKGPTAQHKRNYYLHLAIAPTKQIDRVEWMIEKAVEIGIDEISFLTCKNSERTTIKPERMVKIVESAVKQSLQAFIPVIHGLRSFKDVVSYGNADQKLIAHCFEMPKQEIKKVDFKNKSTLVLIGPEGDFTKEEVEFSKQHHFEALSLGTNRLRTETAGLFVCQAASLLT
jgi:16S rRNA (uracil1498-N3)-methyltransferase